MKLYIIAAALAFLLIIGLWPTLIANGAPPVTQPDGYTKQGAGTSSSPWPSVQNGDILEAQSYTINNGTLVMLRYEVGLDYDGLETSDRKTAADSPYASSRTQIVLYSTGDNDRREQNPGFVADARTIIGSKDVSDFVNRGYSAGFMALYFGSEIYPNLLVEMYGIADAANPVLLAYATPSVKGEEPDFVAAAITQDVRTMLKSVQSSEAWVAETIKLFSTDNILTLAGENYMKDNATYIRHIAPSLYEATLGYPPFHFEYGDSTGAQEEIDEYIDQSSTFRNSFRGLSDWTGVPERTISTIVVMCLAIGLAYFGMRLAENALIVLPIFMIVVSGGAIMGWVPLATLAIIGVCAAVLIAFLVFVKRAG